MRLRRLRQTATLVPALHELVNPLVARFVEAKSFRRIGIVVVHSQRSVYHRRGELESVESVQVQIQHQATETILVDVAYETIDGCRRDEGVLSESAAASSGHAA